MIRIGTCRSRRMKSSILNSMALRRDSKMEETTLPPLAFKVVRQRFRPNASTALSSHPTGERTPLLRTHDPLVRKPPPPNFSTTIPTRPCVARTPWEREKQIHKVLLLNAYTIAHVLLWIPGIAKRFFELTGIRVED